MISNLLSKKELLLAVVPGQDGELVVRHALVSGRHLLATGEGVPTGEVVPSRVSLYAAESYFEQVDLAAASDKLLPLVARRHVDAELVFDDALYRLRALGRARREQTIAADIMALPEKELETVQSLLPLRELPCLQMVPLELAIAALVNKVTSEPAIVFWERGGELVSLLVEGGMVQNRMRERVLDDTRDVVISRAEAGLRAGANSFGTNREIFLTLFMGDLTDYRRDSREKAARALESKLGRLYRLGRNMPEDAVLREPELYGLPLVDEKWSLLDTGYRSEVRAWRYARPMTAAACLAGLLAAMYGGLQHLQALSIASDFDQRRQQLNASLVEYERMRPGDEAVLAVRSHLDVQWQSLDEVRLDRMLHWLTHLVPGGVAIRELEVAPAPQPRQRARSAPVTWPPGEKPFDVRMEILLAETSLDDAEASAADVVRRLSQRLHMVDTRLEVTTRQVGVRRDVILVVRAQARAVDFS